MLKHTIEKINNSERLLEPFPHLMIDDIFTHSLYLEMLGKFPLDTNYMAKLSNMYKDRFVLNLDEHTSPSICQLPDKAMGFWRDFAKHLLSNELMMCLLHKYEDVMPSKYWKNAYPTARLSIDYPPYSIGSHRDRDDKLVSVMLYVPSRKSDEYSEEFMDNYGTALLTPKDKEKKWSMQHHDLTLFNKEKVAPYKSNSLFSWPVVNNSFHGVYPLIYSEPRYTIGYFIKNTTNTRGRFNVS
jgi:hypothetical protein